MSFVYFASDLHFGHKAICKYRTQFSSVNEHDEAILDGVLSCGGKRNSLWLLGDCFFTEESYKALEQICDAYQHVNLVLGNHDTDNSVRLNNIKKAISDGLLNKVGGLFSYKGFWLSHCPVHPDELRGKKNIHGHTHANPINDHRYYSVCLEQTNYKPVDFDEILSHYRRIDCG